MMGEKIHEQTAKTTGYRAIAGKDGDVEVEVSFQGTGKLLGVETTELGTYVTCPMDSGGLYGEGQGQLTTKNGEVVTWQGWGIGKPTGKGFGASWRATICYRTEAPKLSRLNGVIGMCEWEVDEAGNAKGSIWEWR